jgi:hypothetical protein
MQTYLSQVHVLADTFILLFAEALGLPPDGLSKFYDSKDKMQHRAKIVQYPVMREGAASNQGVGPHYDAGFVTIVRVLRACLSAMSLIGFLCSYFRPQIIQDCRCRISLVNGSTLHQSPGHLWYVRNSLCCPIHVPFLQINFGRGVSCTVCVIRSALH